MKVLENKVPPPVVCLIAAGLGWGLALWGPALGLGSNTRVYLASLIFLSGFGCALGGVISFRRAATTVNPLQPEKASSLVTSGIFRFTRNPMYLGLLLCLFSWTMYLDSLLAFIVLPLFAWFISRYQIAPEERALKNLFGNEFETYKSKVRRWL